MDVSIDHEVISNWRSVDDDQTKRSSLLGQRSSLNQHDAQLHRDSIYGLHRGEESNFIEDGQSNRHHGISQSTLLGQRSTLLGQRSKYILRGVSCRARWLELQIRRDSCDPSDVVCLSPGLFVVSDRGRELNVYSACSEFVEFVEFGTCTIGSVVPFPTSSIPALQTSIAPLCISPTSPSSSIKYTLRYFTSLLFRSSQTSPLNCRHLRISSSLLRTPNRSSNNSINRSSSYHQSLSSLLVYSVIERDGDDHYEKSKENEHSLSEDGTLSVVGSSSKLEQCSSCYRMCNLNPDVPPLTEMLSVWSNSSLRPIFEFADENVSCSNLSRSPPSSPRSDQIRGTGAVKMKAGVDNTKTGVDDDTGTGVKGPVSNDLYICLPCRALSLRKLMESHSILRCSSTGRTVALYRIKQSSREPYISSSSDNLNTKILYIGEICVFRVNPDESEELKLFQ